MAFALRDLSVLAYANGFTLWHYKATDDSLEAAGRDGFFNGAAELLGAGDMLMITSAEGGRLAFVAGSPEAGFRLMPATA